MELKDQVCSLELAKRLKELGVKQESLFYWEESVFKVDVFGSKYCVSETKVSLCMPPFDLSRSLDYWSAFTVAELGEMLPSYIINIRASSMEDEECLLDITKRLDDWAIGYTYNPLFPYNIPLVIEKNEADARAKCLIMLIENKLIEVPE